MIRTEFIIAIFAGLALALPYLLYARRTRHQRRIYGAGLVVAAVVYVVLAGLRGTFQDFLTEMAGIVLFGAFAFLGVRKSAYFLALGWAAHVAWDLLLHSVAVSSYAPWWYPVTCIGFDLIVAGAILGGENR